MSYAGSRRAMVTTVALIAAFTGPVGKGTPAPSRFVTAPDGNTVRYRVREQLAGIDFPSDAVGSTTDVKGTVVVGDDGKLVPGESKFVVNVGGLTSDKERRDGYVRRRLLETEQNPSVELALKELQGLPARLPTSGEMAFQVIGDLTVKGVTRPTTWQVKARGDNGAYAGTAATAFTFADFQMTKPRVASVLSVEDTIKLEYDFKLVREGK